jgi:hypothetical protein
MGCQNKVYLGFKCDGKMLGIFGIFVCDENDLKQIK